MNREVFATSSQNQTEAMLAGLALGHRGHVPCLREVVVDCEAGTASWVAHFSLPSHEDLEEDDEED